MPGERNLELLLRGLAPVLDDTPFAFSTMPIGTVMPDGVRVVGTFSEAEGLSLIAPLADLAAAGLPHSASMAKISLEVHSSLEAVGLTAVIATALTKAGISANVVAAYHHDHVFVPWDRREEALRRLAELST